MCLVYLDLIALLPVMRKMVVKMVIPMRMRMWMVLRQRERRDVS